MDFFIENLKETLEAVNGLIKTSHHFIRTKRVREYYGIDPSNHSKINFIWRSLQFLEQQEILTLDNGGTPKKYKINTRQKINIATFMSRVKNTQMNDNEIRNERSMDKDIKTIPMEIIEELLFHIEDIEDFLDNLDLVDYYMNKNGANDAIRDNLRAISTTVGSIEKIIPEFSKKILEMTAIDYVKIGKIIESGFWNANYKTGWSAAQATKNLKKVVLAYGIEE